MNLFPPYEPFPEPVEPPDSEPDAAPLVNPAFSEEWRSYLLGAMASLQMSDTWKGDDSARELAVKRARNLMDIIANAPGLPQFRQTEFCQLQVSFDSGATWTTIFEQCEVPVSHFLIDNPSGTDTNLITPATSVYGIQIQPENASGLIVFPLQNTNAPLVDLYTHGTGAALNLRGDGSGAKITTPNGIVLTSDNFLALRVQTGDSDPPLNSAHRGVLWVRGGTPDVPYYVAQNGASYEARSLVGAAGANGTNGTDGTDGTDGAGITAATLVIGLPTSDPSATLTETPDIQHQQLDLSIPAAPEIVEATVEMLSPVDNPTAVITTREDGDLSLELGIPTAALSTSGLFPGLPDTGAEPLQFDMLVLAAGSLLPWHIPPGYSVQVLAVSGLWQALNSGESYITSARGSATHDETNGIATGNMVFVPSTTDDSGLIVGNLSLSDAFDAFVNETEVALALACNSQVIGNSAGYVMATIEVIASDEIVGIIDTWYTMQGQHNVETINLHAGANSFTVSSSTQDPDAFNDYQCGFTFQTGHDDTHCYRLQWSGTVGDPHAGTSPGAYFDCTGTPHWSARASADGDIQYYAYWRSSTPISITCTLTRHYP